MKQLHQEKRELAEDAKSVRVYRDEVEALRVQSAKVEKLEIEVIKYKQKAEDTDYLKKRIAVSLINHVNIKILLVYYASLYYVHVQDIKTFTSLFPSGPSRPE